MSSHEIDGARSDLTLSNLVVVILRNRVVLAQRRAMVFLQTRGDDPHLVDTGPMGDDQASTLTVIEVVVKHMRLRHFMLHHDGLEHVLADMGAMFGANKKNTTATSTSCKRVSTWFFLHEALGK